MKITENSSGGIFRRVPPDYFQSLQFLPTRVAIALALLLATLGSPQNAHGTALSDAKGSKASCIGIGPIVGKCIKIAEDAGLIKEHEVGTTGLTFEISGKGDGHITQIVPDSAGAQAGLQVGDLIVAINGKPTKPTPGMIAEERTFGMRGAGVDIKVRRDGKALDFNVVRDPQTAPPGPQSGTILIYVHPMINWKGQFIPCMGAGPAGFAAIEMCYKTFGKDGYVKVGELGTTGFQLDADRADAAIIMSVNPDSSASKAGLRAGDEIVQVNETPLGESVGGILPELLFGRAGDSFTLTVQSGESTRTAKLILGKKQKE
jgi:membrane-associated protease RseP (regulator of RpoE activity)